ncbi:MAG: hypothetical protein AAGF79_15705 [Pseudomonadota bacterium]
MEKKIEEAARAINRAGYTVEFAPPRVGALTWLTSRIAGPGGLYNLGNVLALVAGPALLLHASWGQIGVLEAIHQHLIGTPEAIWLTSSILTFLIAGEIYHRAYQPYAAAATRLIQWGDLLSGVAAVLLAITLILVGNTGLALVAGALLAGGKLGNAILPSLHLRGEVRLAALLRYSAIVSRAPSLAVYGWVVLEGLQAAIPLADLMMPLVMIVCFLLWLAADLLLLRR